MLVKYLQRHLARYNHQRLLIRASISLLQGSYNAETHSSATKHPIAKQISDNRCVDYIQAGQFPSIIDLWKILSPRQTFQNLQGTCPLPKYSKVPIIRTGTYASSAVHTMYCQNYPMFRTLNRSFRVTVFRVSGNLGPSFIPESRIL